MPVFAEPEKIACVDRKNGRMMGTAALRFPERRRSRRFEAFRDQEAPHAFTQNHV